MSFFFGESSDYSRQKNHTERVDPYRFNKEPVYNPKRQTANQETIFGETQPVGRRTNGNFTESWNNQEQKKVNVRVNPNFTENVNKPVPTVEARVNPNFTQSTNTTLPKQPVTRLNPNFTETGQIGKKIETRVNPNFTQTYQDKVKAVDLRKSNTFSESGPEIKRTGTKRDNRVFKSTIFDNDTNVPQRSNISNLTKSSIVFGDERATQSMKTIPRKSYAKQQVDQDMQIAGVKKDKDPSMLGAFKKKVDPSRHATKEAYKTNVCESP